MIKTYEKFNEPKVEINHYSNGQKEFEIWLLNGKRHKKDGPAYQTWYENGQKLNEIWYLNDKLHREDGPAYQRWSENGQKNYEIWSLKGIYYSRVDWINQLKKIGSPHYEEQQMLLDMEKYNI